MLPTMKRFALLTSAALGKSADVYTAEKMPGA
jgi:hypothetical protein